MSLTFCHAFGERANQDWLLVFILNPECPRNGNPQTMRRRVIIETGLNPAKRFGTRSFFGAVSSQIESSATGARNWRYNVLGFFYA
jgi:hypothetical protein